MPRACSETTEEEGHDHAEEEPVKIDWRRHNVRFHGGFRNLPGAVEGVRMTVNYLTGNIRNSRERKSARVSATSSGRLTGSRSRAKWAGCPVVSAHGACRETSTA